MRNARSPSSHLLSVNAVVRQISNGLDLESSNDSAHLCNNDPSFNSNSCKQMSEEDSTINQSVIQELNNQIVNAFPYMNSFNGPISMAEASSIGSSEATASASLNPTNISSLNSLSSSNLQMIQEEQNEVSMFSSASSSVSSSASTTPRLNRSILSITDKLQQQQSHLTFDSNGSSDSLLTRTNKMSSGGHHLETKHIFSMLNGPQM